MAEYIETYDQKECLPEQQVPAVFFRFLKNLFSAMGYDVRIVTFENHKDFTTSIRATWEDVAPVRHGRWNDDGSCSVCGRCDWDNVECKYFLYCPNCGAKMDLEGEE